MSNFAFYLHDEKDPARFEEELLWFKKRYNLISFSEFIDYLYDGKPLKKNSCLLTVDDGWLSTYQVIFPIIKKHNVPITIFVSPDVVENECNFWYYDIRNFDESSFKAFLAQKNLFRTGFEAFPLEYLLKELPIETVYSLIDEYRASIGDFGRQRGFINVSELKEMATSELVEIGAHTMTHPILSNETAEKSVSEISESITRLSELLGRRVRSFAYPNGLYGVDYGEREISTVKSMGIEAAFSVDPGYIKSSKNPLSLPRIGSLDRLKLPFGIYLPSRARQAQIRKKIREFLK